MIIIDGRESSLHINNFANLEELLISVQESHLENRIVTDVLVNDENFSELYPHQAEDIDSDELRSIEIRSVPYDEMAMNVTEELYKVTDIINTGSRRVADLFRQADDNEALELFQDVLEVIRNFMGMVNVLRNDFSISVSSEFVEKVEQTSALLSEISDVLENEDWILLSDLLEYELVPVCEAWKSIIDDLQTIIRNSQQQQRA
jgi:hypothetical protein